MNLQKKQITRAVVLLLLSQATNSLLTSRVQFHRGVFSQNFPFRKHHATTINIHNFSQELLPSFSTTSLQVMIPGRSRARAKHCGGFSSTISLTSLMQVVRIELGSLISSIIHLVRKYWWCFPMVLAFIPPYCVLFKGSCASMPDWWKVVNLDHIFASDSANLIIGQFLGSNVAYVFTGSYLLKRFRFFGRSQSGSTEIRPTEFSMLGVWVLMAGLISTVFHSVQALGSYVLAENLCYLDHAVACSAILYFFKTCGIPSKTASVIGAVSLVTLVVSTPGYAWFHSTWHYLSAATATRWALDGYNIISLTESDTLNPTHNSSRRGG